MQDFPRNSKLKDKLFMIVGTIVGGSTTLIVMTNLPIVQANLISSIALATLIVTCAYLSNPVLWWMGMGAIAGIIIGLGGVMAGHLAESKEPLELNLRLTFVAFQSLAGFIAGILLGRKIHKAHLPTLKELLSSLSALTVGLFAVIVTMRFIVDGLEQARSLSSRLSASTTILITLLAIPGTVGYLLAERRTKAANLNQSDISGRPDRHQ
ncbi:hypothetical protein IQ238_29690 [Pleurocapsales cyanobacterium LEGE 06147]|nr:hypothetical protein [Pleurocapsales cyanobacterium LEGE 06147]